MADKGRGAVNLFRKLLLCQPPQLADIGDFYPSLSVFAHINYFHALTSDICYPIKAEIDMILKL